MKISSWVCRYFAAQLHDAHHLPTGGAIIVSNHAFVALDSLVLIHLLKQETGRMPRGLAERDLFRAPGVANLLARVGAVMGSPHNAIGLLEAGELVLTYPAGAAGSFKGPEDRYRLCWRDNAMGYLKVAAQTRTPIVPLVGIGIDDAFPAVARERVLGRRLFGSERYDLSLVLGMGPLPWPVKFDFFVGEPLTLEQPDLLLRDTSALRAEHQRIWRHTQALLNHKLNENGLQLASRHWRA